MRKILTLLPAILLLIGGIALGDWLHGQKAAAHVEEGAEAPPPPPLGPTVAYAFPNQFFVPIVRNGTLRAMMVLGLGMEVAEGKELAIHAREYQLRDALLRALMIHANTGGFDGNFTSEPHLRLLSQTLLAAAQGVAGDDVRAILIGDIARQAQ